MRCKLPEAETVRERGEYLCLACEARIIYEEKGTLICRGCGNKNASDLVPVYIEDDLEEEAMYCPLEWGQGD